ncbi:hypothetical protein NQ318_017375 [Aromia moschata]|uniref:Uncharacterized protein n=1 Tax=Aromia moschata TaxID=1265417 RepID=A0AAV8Z2B5_9CUCU|nr:hypothetical protein NQ318_017375 [Aromia moschata]
MKFEFLAEAKRHFAGEQFMFCKRIMDFAFDMISRSKQILKLALSLERPELYYPKYESTKGLTDSSSLLPAFDANELISSNQPGCNSELSKRKKNINNEDTFEFEDNGSNVLPAFDANELIGFIQPGCDSELSKRKKNKNNEDTFEFEDNDSNVLPAFDANELISSNQPGCDSELSKRKKNKNNEDTFEFEDNDSNLLPAFSANELICFNKPGCDNELSKRKEKKKNKNNQNTFKFEDNAVNSFPVLEEPMSFDGYDSDKDPEFQPNDDDLEESESEFDCEFSPKFEENNNRNIEKKFRTIVNDSEENEICTTFNAVKRNRSQHFCFYCEEHVKQFSRHIVRNHKYEFEVQKILFLPKQSKERKQLITNLRNKGDFLCRQNGDDLKFRKNMIHDPLPCEHCLGFYSRKRLWIHKKYCSLRPSNDISKFSAGSAQTLLVSNLKMDRELIERVFPRMRADKISLTAKKDALICAFGSRFLKIHRDKHQVLVTSRKMRELAKVLIEMKKLNPQVNSLIEALRPINFDLLVKAVKAASKFNSEEDKYGAPTFAMNISTSLKDCCEVAICEILKKKHCFENKNFSETETEIKTMIMLIKSNWKYEISHHAANNLHSKKMNSIGIVPLASDLKKFKDYLKTTANSAAAKLQSDCNDRDAYKTLQQTVYCRIMLLCRKRPGELARLTVDLYNEGKEAQTYEEFENKIRPSERILMRKFKRVVIKGKRKATPVLFSLDVQEHIQILLDLRSNFTSQNDPYIFSKLISREPFRGYQVLMHHAKMAGLKKS